MNRFLLPLIVVVAWALQVPPALAASGDLDPTFGTNGREVTPLPGYDSARGLLISGGSLIAAGRADSTTQPDFGTDMVVARYSNDGKQDKTFGTPGYLGPLGFARVDVGSGTEEAFDVVAQSDGHLVAVGSATAPGGSLGFAAERFTADGSTMTSTVVDVGPGVDRAVAVTAQSNDKVILAGYSNNGTDDDVCVVRLNADGSVDPGFGSATGVTSDFGSNEHANGVAVLSTGKVLVSGWTGDDAARRFFLARYTAGGQLDTTFGTHQGWVTTKIGMGTDTASAMVRPGDGTTVVAGTAFNGTDNDVAVVRYMGDGTLDPGFGSGGKVMTDLRSGDDAGLAVTADPTGIYVGGRAFDGTQDLVAVAKYDNTGSLVSGFGSGGKAILKSGLNAAANDIVLQGSNVVVAGYSFTTSYAPDFLLARFTGGGVLDSTFGKHGRSTSDFPGFGAQINAVQVQSDGKIVAGGEYYRGSQYDGDFLLIRYNTDGTIDTSFGEKGIVVTSMGGNDAIRGLSITGGGTIVVAGLGGAGGAFALAEYDSGGILDPTFGNGDGKVFFSDVGGYGATSVVVQADGNIVVCGPGRNVTSAIGFRMIRYTSTGALDVGYGSNGTTLVRFGTQSGDVATPSAVRIDSSGRAVAAGTSSTFSTGAINFAVVRLTHAGDLDHSFSGDGKQTTNFGGEDRARGVRIDSNGNIVVAGWTQPMTAQVSFAVARYTTGGQLDSSFENGGKVTTDFPTGSYTYGAAVRIQTDGKIVVAGDSDGQFALARYLTDGTLDASFGSGGLVTTSFLAEGDELAVGYAEVIQNDGRIVVAGSAGTSPAANQSVNSTGLARYEP